MVAVQLLASSLVRAFAIPVGIAMAVARPEGHPCSLGRTVQRNSP
jgi:hypothetical protein